MKIRSAMVMGLLLALLCAAALAEAPASLPAATTVEEVESFLIYPPEDDLAGVQAGYVRLIPQHRAGDDMFRDGYWIGGEVGGDFDLTRQKNRYGHPYTYHVGNMCTRAVYSMALSYLGIDMTPGDMSALIGRRDMNPPYKSVSRLVGVELVEPRSFVFDTMMNNYLADPSYSPVYLYVRKPDGQDHALLVVAATDEPSRYLVVDPSGMWLNGVQHRVYMIALNKTRAQIVNSDFRTDYAGSKVLRLYQWRLLPEEP